MTDLKAYTEAKDRVERFRGGETVWELYGANPATTSLRADLNTIAAYEAQTVEPASFQSRVQSWVVACFGEEISRDAVERADRFVEEALELVQSTGYTADRAHALVDYVFGRPIGEPYQEAGGVMVTLATLLHRHEIDMIAAGETELARVNAPEIVEKIRAKQAAKPTGSALPVAVTQPAHQAQQIDARTLMMAHVMGGLVVDDGWSSRANLVSAALAITDAALSALQTKEPR